MNDVKAKFLPDTNAGKWTVRMGLISVMEIGEALILG